MYSFAQRDDTLVVDEPLYGHYLRVTGADHPGRDEILAAMDTDGNRVMQTMLNRNMDRPLLFIKQMAHHLVGLDHAFLQRMVNILLIRDPREMLPSLIIQLPDASVSDTGLAQQYELLQELRRLGQDPVVLDSRELVQNPSRVLHKLCQKIGIPFTEKMLRWPAEARPEDGVWARYWYHRVHESTGFAPYRPKTEPFPAHLQPLLEQCQPFYDRLSQSALTADDQERGSHESSKIAG